MDRSNIKNLREIAKSLLPKATLISSNANEAFRISFFKLNDTVIEVCYELSTGEIEDIKLLDGGMLEEAQVLFS